MYAQVIVDIVHENVAHTFTYAVPEGMALSVGQRVEVPFGFRSKEGVVIALDERCDLPPEKVRPVTAPLEDYPAILPCLIDLARQMAEDAHCPLAETLRLMLPAEMRGGRVQVKQQPVCRLAIPTGQVEEAMGQLGRSQKKRMLLQLLREEDKTRPRSDQKLTEAIQAAGIPVARRTIANYREALGYPCAALRKTSKERGVAP